MVKKQRNYIHEKQKRKTIPLTFSCPLWIYDVLCRKENKTEFITESLEREINTNSNKHEKIKQLRYRAKDYLKKVYDLQEQIKELTKEGKNEISKKS